MSPRADRIPAPNTSVAAPTHAYTTARRDMRSAVNASVAMSATPRGPPFHSFFRCPSAITVSAFRFVLSSLARIARAVSDSGQADPLPSLPFPAPNPARAT